MSISSSTSPEPLFTVTPTLLRSDKSDRSERVSLSVYNSRKVTLIVSREFMGITFSSKKFELEPEGFGGAYCDNKDFLNDKHSWSVKQGSDKTYTVYAKLRTLGGGNGGSTARASGSKKTSTKEPALELDKDVRDYFTHELKFYPEDYKDKEQQRIALRNICYNIHLASEPDLRLKFGIDVNLTLRALDALLSKIKASPEGRDSRNEYIFLKLFSTGRPINEAALELFFAAKLPPKLLPLNDIISHHHFPLFKRALDDGSDPNQVFDGYEDYCLSNLFQSDPQLDDEKNFKPLLHWIASKSDRPEFLTYLMQKESLNLNIRNAMGRTPLMSIMNRPEECSRAIEILVKAGAKMDLLDSHGRTALFYLLMTAQPLVFEKHLNLLLEYGLDLNRMIKDVDSHFTQCLKLLIEFDTKNPKQEIWKKPYIRANIQFMLKKGVDLTLLSNNLYLLLPDPIQKVVQNSLSGELSDDSAETSTSNSSPTRLSESPQKASPMRSNELDRFCKLASLYDPALSEATHKIAFRNILENAFKEANLGLLLISKDDDSTVKELFSHLITLLTPHIEKKAHQNEAFEIIVTSILEGWKGKNKNTELTQQKNQALVQHEESMKEMLNEAKLEREKAEKANESAIAHADDARRAQNAAASSRLNAAQSANRAQTNVTYANGFRW